MAARGEPRSAASTKGDARSVAVTGPTQAANEIRPNMYLL
jgi:hypothetical protein